MCLYSWSWLYNSEISTLTEGYKLFVWEGLSENSISDYGRDLTYLGVGVRYYATYGVENIKVEVRMGVSWFEIKIFNDSAILL